MGTVERVSRCVVKRRLGTGRDGVLDLNESGRGSEICCRRSSCERVVNDTGSHRRIGTFALGSGRNGRATNGTFRSVLERLLQTFTMEVVVTDCCTNDRRVQCGAANGTVGRRACVVLKEIRQGDSTHCSTDGIVGDESRRGLVCYIEF